MIWSRAVLTVLGIAALAAGTLGMAPPAQVEARGAAGGARFGWVDVHVESGERPFAAYQIELREVRGLATVVGIEGGEHPEFAEPPHYDPEAMMTERVIIAAYSTAAAGELPAGSSRVARVHVRLAGDGEPEYVATLQAAAGHGGEPVALDVTLRPGEAQ